MERLMAFARLAIAALVVITVADAAARAAEPMDLRDPQPRWISVRFENSPSDRPGQLATDYAAELPAWFEPDRASSRVPSSEYQTRSTGPVAGEARYSSTVELPMRRHSVRRVPVSGAADWPRRGLASRLRPRTAPSSPQQARLVLSRHIL